MGADRSRNRVDGDPGRALEDPEELDPLADDLDLSTRILTACDVYDALVSPRVYRPAWSRAQAIELLRGESGVAFDARCVTALEQVLDGHATKPARAAPRSALGQAFAS